MQYEYEDGAALRAPDEILLCYAVTVEIEDHDKPALVAEWLTLRTVSK